MHARRPTCALVALGATVALIATAGCGSSKPSYCSDRDKLESSIKGLTNLTPSSGVSGLESQLKTIQRDATALADSARSDFPSESSAVESSVNRLASSVRALPSSPSATQIATLATDAASVVSSVRGFADATSSKCN